MSTNTPHQPESFTERSFWSKLKRHGGKIGCPLLCRALTMYYTLRDSKTPTWVKTTILGALGYLISFIDAIPDIIPVVGYTDDLTVIAAAMATIAIYIKPEHKDKAQSALNRLGLENCKCADELPPAKAEE